MGKISAGLLPVENTIMVQFELDGAISPIVFGGRRVSEEMEDYLGKNKTIRKVRIFRSKHDFFQRKVSLLARKFSN